MNYPLKVRAVGNSLGVILPKEVVGDLQVSEGDTLYITESPDGFRITSKDPAFAKAMEVYRRGAKRYRNALGELAK
ncbi:AbrB/MazE/SpoVT family DNA-binding domain-containing protein [Nibricoccus sp. IMCC34717]|uniref:AbrB/MazE/SpoVT family DNA-binding domain-containing protein n=1 Tax=Nibricoccus sp. IMCC34717 TaxID=3034021 RepID=UPI00384E44B3